jgi:small neutral amino acid transporter SnatA (MarC family)
MLAADRVSAWAEPHAAYLGTPMDTSKILHDFLVLFVDPIGSVLIFSGLAAGLDARQRRRLAWRSTWIAGVVMIAFMAIQTLFAAPPH